MLSQLGRYEILEEIGRGAMGVVYRARDPRIDRVVVLKALRRDLMESPDVEKAFVERFYREARAAGKLSHPSIVTIHDVDKDETAGIDFIAMEHVAGATLQELLSSGARLSNEQVMDIALKVADALDYAHGKGVVHRDIKPANLMLREDGIVKVMDFGIARMEGLGLTRTGEYVGTPNYMSPEQIMGASIDGRADQFSLCIVLYQLLTGVRPFSGENLTTISYKIVNEEPVPPLAVGKGVSPAVSSAIMRGLSKERDRRFASCRELVMAVAEGLREPAVADVEATRAETLRAPELQDAPPTMVHRPTRTPVPGTPVAAMAAPAPSVRPQDEGGDVSGQTLSLLHEVKRLESVDAVERARARPASVPARDEDSSVFDVEDSAVTKVHERTPLPVVRSFMPAEAEPIVRTTDAPEATASRESGPATLDGETAPYVPPKIGDADAEVTKLGASRRGSDAVAPASTVTAAVVATPVASRPAGPTVLFLVVITVAVALSVALLAMVGYWLYETRGEPRPEPEPTPPASGPVASASVPSVKELSEQHFSEGIIAYKERRWDDAERELKAALSIDPANQAASDYLRAVQQEGAKAVSIEPTIAPTEVPATPTVGVETADTATEPPLVATSNAEPPPATGKMTASHRAESGTHQARATASTPSVEVPAEEAELLISFEHNLKKGHLTVEVDGHMRLSATFEAKKKKVGPIKLPRSIFDTNEEYPVAVPAGDHDVRIHIVAPDDDVDTQDTRHYSFGKGSPCKIALSVGRVDKNIEISKHCR